MDNFMFDIEGDPNGPVTRGEFAEAIHLVGNAFEKVATKEDLKQFATKDDIQRIKQQMAADKEELLRAIQASLEITRDQLVGVTEDQISAIEEKQERHEQRITAVERHFGNPPA